jgi:phosphate transport system substrate-binding protein
MFLPRRNVAQKFNRYLLSFFLITTLLSACSGSQSPISMEGDTLKGNITISGAFALYPMMTRWAEEFQKIHPNVHFDISGGGAGKGMTDTLSGAVDIGMVSRSIRPEEESQGAFYVGCAKDAVFPVINAVNPVLGDLMETGVTQETFRKIFITGEIKTWGEVVGKPDITEEIHLYTRSDSAGAAEMWAQYLGGKGQADLNGIGVNADPGLLDAVIKDPLGIGYNNLGYAFDLSTGKIAAGAALVPIDVNENGEADDEEIIATLTEATNAVATGKYPSPPGRVLYLVTKGKPVGLIKIFITWILTDGQKFIPEAGFVPLAQEQLNAALELLK